MLGTASAAVCLWLCGAATSPAVAQDAAPTGSSVLNSQMQLGDVVAGQQLNVQEADGGTSAASTAVANAVSAATQNSDLAFTSHQLASGSISATNQVSVAQGGAPYTAVATSATGNTSDAGTCCGTVSGHAEQSLQGPGVGAVSNLNVGGYASNTSATATALGNTQGWSATTGAVNASAAQASTGGVTASNTAVVQAADQANYITSAVANDVEVSGTISPVTMSVQQSQAGVTQGLAQVGQDYGGDATSTSSAVANNFNVVSDSYGNSITSNQTNSGAVNAANTQTVGTWYGTTTTTGYGVANSTLIANAGSYTGSDTSQTNSGAVTVNVGQFGGGLGEGGAAYASATGVGNAVSAYACASCNGAISARNKQVNSGSVHSTTSLTASNVSTASGVASAVGNTATYQVVGGSD
jgi:hypothetical protein